MVTSFDNTTLFEQFTIANIHDGIDHSNKTGDDGNLTALVTIAQQEEHIETGVYIYIILMSLVLAIAISSNLLIIYCVVRLKNLRTVTNIFICNLSISDILLAAYVMPLKLHDISHHDQDWYEGKANNHTV